MNKRPLGVTIICWIIIVVSILSFISSLILLTHPDKLSVLAAQNKIPERTLHYNLIVSLVIAVINFILAFFMLNRANWARHFYLIFNAVLYIAALIILPAKIGLLIAILIFIIYLYFLYNKPANEYFTGSSSTRVPPQQV